jgi:hypothetical protein
MVDRIMKKKKKLILNQSFETKKQALGDENSKSNTSNKWASFTHVGNKVLSITKLLKKYNINIYKYLMLFSTMTVSSR